MKIFYKPARTYLIIDILLVVLSFYVVLDWFPLTTTTPFNKYSWPSLFFILFWLVTSYLFGRYRKLRLQRYFRATLKLFYVSALVFILFFSLIYFSFKAYSGYVLLSITIGVFIINYVLLSIYFAYRYAVDYDDTEILPVEDRKNGEVKYAEPLDDEAFSDLCNTIREHSSNDVLKFLNKYVDLRSGNTLVYLASDSVNFQLKPNFQFSSVVQLERLNNMRGVDKLFKILNQKLPDNGTFVCCFESKSTRKKRILKRYPKGINYFVYSIDFIIKRIVPKIFITRRLYYDITRGKNRIFSKVEVLGRLYCFGFKVVLDKKIDDLTYVIAQRVKRPEIMQKRIYGPLIRLRRFGKNGKSFVVYKMRTMHPYSEYLQAYIFERNSLKTGGKFNKDIRITNVGSFMRKYWLDELPMVYNLLKGDMKLVGVRPLSAHYYSLYSKELQEKRNRFKPGLLPPFYADMPQTIEEIQASEMDYLIACETKGVFITDLRYLFLILKNILIKKARSS
jgi:lipopolysaccharide/colanic/teichoic acid biosynthesis glycosyltransferase